MESKYDRIFAGIVIGIAVGLFIDSLILLKYGGWMLAFILPVAAPVILSAAFFGFLGYMGLFRIPRAAVFLIALVAWPLSFTGPIWMRGADLSRKAHSEIPLYRDAQKKSVSVTAVAGDGHPHVDIGYEVRGNFREIADFYLKELPGRGWRISRDYELSFPQGKGLLKGRQIIAKKDERDQHLGVTVKDGDPVQLQFYYRSR